ncbi:restriction endonuclease subunit S [Pseudomonas sp. phDV1]|nr:restriction endonuclease subunit S [Pseudomonas sp. phDV1]AXO60205.1 restriction endonuclease subunit S [Pseudomonas sp. phDV1]
MTWETVRLGKIAIEDRRIVAPDSVEALSRPYLGLEQIESGTGRVLSYDGNSVEGKSTTFAFDERHVLYGKLRPYLNKVVTPEHKGRCSTEIIPLLPNGAEREFLAFLLRTDKVVSAAMSEKTGSRMPRADMSILLDFEVLIPRDVSVQQQIAAALKDQLTEVERARQAAQSQISEAVLLRHRLLRQTLKTLTDTQRKALGAWARTTSGSTPSRSDKRYWSPAEIPWVKTGEVAFQPISGAEESISRQALTECSLTLLPPGTVLIAMYGQGKTRGQSAVLRVEATINQACFAILPNETWDADFLHYWLMASYEDLRRLSEGRGGNQANLNGGLLNSLQIPAPAIDEQRLIVNRLKAQLAEVDAIAQAAAMQLAEIERLPQKLLAQAFDTQGA